MNANYCYNLSYNINMAMIWYHVNEEFYGRHNDRIDLYETSISQITMILSPMWYFFLFNFIPFHVRLFSSIIDNYFTGLE